MIISRLIRVISDIVDDYNNYNIIDLLTQFHHICATRGQINQNSYKNSINDFRSKSKIILETAKTNDLSSPEFQFFNTSKYRVSMPTFIANLILTGAIDNKDLMMMSTEAKIYLDQATVFLRELRIMINFCNEIDQNEKTLDDDKFAIDIRMPRVMFDNKIENFIKNIDYFSKLFSYICELVGQNNKPDLFILSTTTPVVGILAHFTEIWCYIKIYGELLTIAKNQLDLFAALKQIREVDKKADDGMDERLKQSTQKQIGDAVEKIVTQFTDRNEAIRTNEIRNAIELNCLPIVNLIENGARVNISIESSKKMQALGESQESITTIEISNVIERQLALEKQISQIYAAIEQKQLAPMTINPEANSPQNSI